MPDVISVEGIECHAHHGCLPEEAIIGGRFLVDVYVYCDVSKSFQTDHLEDTIDYVMIFETVKLEMAVPSKLIEHACARIADRLTKKIKLFDRIEVRVTKFNPPVNGGILKTSFLISRSGQ
jgi:dihydroneopterin aldolase